MYGNAIMDNGWIVLIGGAVVLLLIAPAGAGPAPLANVMSAPAPTDVLFTDTTGIADAVPRTWFLGDTARFDTSDPAARSVVHTYPEPGSYTVTPPVATRSSATTTTTTVDTFTREQAISVANPSGVDGLAVAFNATHLPGMRPDFADIRFVERDGTTIPHWTEDITSGAHARVWLALPAGATTITMLYGNPEARDESDPDAVFLFFEDYEQGDLSRWSFCGSNAIVQSEVVRDGAYAGDINVSEPDLRHLANNRICLANISAEPLIIEGDFRVSEFGKWCGSGYLQAWNGTDRLYAFHLRNGSMQHYDGAHRNFSADARAETDTWYHVRVILDTRNATEDAWVDGEHLGQAPLRFADGTPVPRGTVFTDFALIGSSAWSSGDPHHFYGDNIVIRRFSPVEPVLSYGSDP